MKSNYFILFIMALFCAALVFGQNRVSPKQVATGKIGDATITINYSSPAVKGRKVWGELVPYNKVWRTGANEATLIETDKDLLVEGKKLPSGKYSLYAIPGESEWQIIINSQTGQWGIKRDGETTRLPENDVLVASVTPGKSSTMAENLVYEVNKNGVVLKWENVAVPLSIVQQSFSQESNPTNAADTEQIRKLLSDYAASVNNMDTILAKKIWAINDSISFIHPRGHEKGWQQIKENFYIKTMFANFSERKLNIHDLAIRAYKDFAFVEFYWTFNAKLRKDGAPLTTKGRESQVL